MDAIAKLPGRAKEKTPAQIFHITEDHSPGNTGVTGVVTQLAGFLAAHGWPVTILATGAGVAPLPAGVGLKEFPLGPGGSLWRYPAHLGSYLRGMRGDAGVVFHLHGVWQAPQWLAARAATRQGIPAVLTVHDMLSPWHWHDGRLRQVKKLIYWHLLGYPAFRHLPLIHAITPVERDNLARQFPGQRLEVIPNAIDLPEADTCLAALEPTPATGRPYLLFLGRLHPKKGVEILISAFARVRPRRAFRLLIAGPDDSPTYTRMLQARVRSLGLGDRVVFLGPVQGVQKWRLYRDAWAFCAPSRSEVVGLVNLEAAAARVPLITTYETGVPDWAAAGGLLIHPRGEELSQALEQVCAWSDQEREERGLAGRRLVERRYSLEAVGPLWLELYSELAEAAG